ncbi:MAG: hypothetical protein IKE46_12035 [Selenomonadaceae bacterium]|nr:hypothetical protein [Selenomonadaceae bacterium]
MSNEEKILSMLTKMQDDLVEIKKRIAALESEKMDDSVVEKQLETLNKMRHLLTKEEAEAVAAAIGE